MSTEYLSKNMGCLTQNYRLCPSEYQGYQNVKTSNGQSGHLFLSHAGSRILCRILIKIKNA
jgi:hypothetical protein